MGAADSGRSFVGSEGEVKVEVSFALFLDDFYEPPRYFSAVYGNFFRDFFNDCGVWINTGAFPLEASAENPFRPFIYVFLTHRVIYIPEESGFFKMQI